MKEVVDYPVILEAASNVIHVSVYGGSSLPSNILFISCPAIQIMFEVYLYSPFNFN